MAQVGAGRNGDLGDRAFVAIDVLVYAAVFLHESILDFNDLLIAKAEGGCRVRIALGDPASPNVAARGREERFGVGIESRCELALMHYRPLVGTRNVEVRTHGTTLYNSIYRADDDLMVNGHLWGVNAFGAPIWRLRRHPSGSMADAYLESFEAVWDQATPVA